mgnify:CR=1 FL=1
MKLFYSCVFALCICTSAFAQTCQFSFKGKVIDLHDNQPLIGASLQIVNGNKFATTNVDGSFEIKSICEGTYTIIVRHVSCKTKRIKVNIIKDTYKEISLEHHLNQLNEVEIKTINFTKTEYEKYNLILSDEKKAQISYSNPLKYLYEPNAAILKAGAFKSAANEYNAQKIAEHSHLYTSDQLINFPGRCFSIQHCIAFNKKEIKKLGITKANITTRNFPDSVSNIRKKFKIKDGGATYLFFTTDAANEKLVVVCEKI